MSPIGGDIDLVRRKVGELFWLARDASAEEPSCGVDESRDRMATLVADILMTMNQLEESTDPEMTRLGHLKCEVSR